MPTLPPERWQDINRLFEAALERAPAERDAFLTGACGGDGVLRREVESLLDAIPEAEHALGESAAEYASPLLDAVRRETGELERTRGVGERIGPYRIVEEIGRGGMGAVYIAERADEAFAKRVAIKLVQRGMDTEEGLRRFRDERQILASLEHPGIARLYDGGLAEDGRPYLVMEYVEGRPIDVWCDERHAGVEERLRLFLTVCDAVEYAHQNLVVHRDIKPSNISVTADGGVKLLDFGIAKLVPAEVSAGTTEAPTGLRAMTPEYASPEQVLGRRITTASDVYGLGVLLYHLLTGRRPIEVGDRDSYGMIRAVAEQEPKPPSAAAVALGEGAAAARATTPDRLSRRLRGDLDAILLRALAKDPSQRYQSARQLAEDLTRHLEGLPVLARRPTIGYRMRRVLRRHRAAASATATLLLLLAGFAVFYNLRVTRERDLAQAARERAERERSKAEQVVGFLTGMLAAADPEKALGDTLTVYDVLSRSEAGVDTALASQPEVRAELWSVLGRTYHGLGDDRRAKGLLSRAYALRRSLAGDTDSTTLAIGSHLVDAHLALGEHAEAEKLARQVLESRREQLGESHALVAAALNQLGAVRYGAGDMKGAADYLAQSLAMHRSTGATPAVLATNLNDLGIVLKLLNRPDEAEPLLREALAVRQAALPPDHPEVAQTMINLGALLRDRGRYAPAESLFREALATRQRVFGAGHQSTAEALLALAYTKGLEGEYAEAERLHGEVLETNRRRLGNAHPELGMNLVALGNLAKDQGDFTKAERLFRRALDLMQPALGPDHPRTSMALLGLGTTLVARGTPGSAEPFLRRAAAARTRAFGPTHLFTLHVEAELGWCLARLGRVVEAESLMVRSHAAWPRPPANPIDSVLFQRLRGRLIEFYLDAGRPERAAEYGEPLATRSVPAP